MMDELILQGLGVIVTALVAWVATAIQRKTGVEIEEKHRKVLHSALLTGAKLALSRSLTGSAAISLIKDVARRTAPDAIKYFDLERRVQNLDDLAESKLQELFGLQVDLPIDKIITEDRLAAELERILGPGAVRKPGSQ